MKAAVQCSLKSMCVNYLNMFKNEMFTTASHHHHHPSDMKYENFMAGIDHEPYLRRTVMNNLQGYIA